MSERDDQPTAAPRPGVPDPLATLSLRHRLARLGRLVRKELSEVLRDRRTIITLVLMPLLLYPLLAMAFPQFLLGLGGGREGPDEYRIGVPAVNEAEAAKDGPPRALPVAKFLELYLRDGLQGPAARLSGAVAAPAGGGSLAAALALLTWRDAGAAALPLPPMFDPLRRGGRAPPRLTFFEVKDMELALRGDALDLGVRIRDASPTAPRQRREWELVYLARSPRALEAVALLERLCLASSAEQLQAHLKSRGDSARLPLLRVVRRPISEPGGGGLRDSLKAVIPLILILMTITGAVYPAIDVTAGERERGTLEILVAAPVPRLSLLFAKYVSVLTVAVLTATVNLGMMLVTLHVSGLAQALAPAGELSAGTVLLMFALLLLFAAFFSAVLLALTSFARSFKEAQAYLIPLMLASLAPGVLAMLPGLELTGLYAVTPLLNIVLLARDLFAGHAEAATSLVVVLSTLVYAVAALAGAARIFGAESVLYSESGGWSDLFRRPTEQRPVATMAGALLALALLFPVSFVANSLLAQAPAEARTGLQALMTLVLFAGLPLLGAAWGRLRLRTAFALRPAPWLALAGALLLGAGLMPLVGELLALLRAGGLTFHAAELSKRLAERVQEWRALSPVVLVVGLAVIGAAEELFFRGYLFSALRRAGGARAAIFGSAVLFGLFHCVTWFDRLVPSTVMGLVLGWVCWRAGSVVAPMLLHACYDALLGVLAYHRVGPESGEHLPMEWVVAGVAGTVVGAALIWFSGPAREAAPDDGSEAAAT